MASVVFDEPKSALREGNRWLKVVDVVRITRFSRAKVYQLMNAGTLKSIRVGGSRRISELELAQFMETFERASSGFQENGEKEIATV